MRALSIPALLAALAALSMGCGTISSYANGCPGVFSGVRTDVEYLGGYDSFSDAFDLATVSVDIPLSAAADTVTLPVAALVNSTPDQAYGCGWAVPSPTMAQRNDR